MHRSVSHTGTSSAMLRFSHCAVATGYVPSTGKALTGSRSPRPLIISSVTLRTKSGISPSPFGRGDHHLIQMCQRRIDGREVLADDRLAALAVGFSDRLFDFHDRFIARQHAADREKARLHDRVDAIAELIVFSNRVGVN